MSISSVDSGPLHVKPPVDLNLQTEANRILFVLNKVIARARFVGVLGKIIKQDGYLLQDIFDGKTVVDILQTFAKYETQKFSVIDRFQSGSSSGELLSDSDDSSRRSVDVVGRASGDDDDDDAADDDDEDDDVDFTSVISSSVTLTKKTGRKDILRFDDTLAKMIYMLEENPEVQKLADSMKKELSPQMKFFIKCLTEFKDKMAVRLNENAEQYKTWEKYMRETYEKNEKAKKEIEKLEDALIVTKTDANVCLIGRNILINRHQKKIEKIQQNSLDAIEKRINESEKAMVNDWQKSIVQQERLKQDFQQASEKYSHLLRDHLAAEKILRAKRTKVENQVLGWIQKFDQDIGEKQAEEEEIQALLDQETSEVNEIQKLLDEQEEEYDELMQEKAAFEEEMLERRLYQFIVNRSARRIQRTYRLYKARKLAKKLAKKGKKGKKKGK